MKEREGRTDGKEEGEERSTEPQNRNHSDRNHQRESKSQSSPETAQFDAITGHGRTRNGGPEMEKKMAKEVESGGAELERRRKGQRKKITLEAICAPR